MNKVSGTVMKTKAYLVFADGEVMEGQGFGAGGKAIGELVFNTSMGGGREILTDPACYGQLLTLTYPLLGEYGEDEDILLSERPAAAGLIVRESLTAPESQDDTHIDSLLKRRGIVAVGGLDTRKITAKLRDAGQSVKAAVVHGDFDKAGLLCRIEAHTLTGAVEAVTVKKEAQLGGGERNMGVLDFGCNTAVLRSLLNRDCQLTVLPATTSAEEIIERGFDGLVLSDGPGDPHENTAIIAQIAALAGKLPVLALGLGCQMLALALGAEVERLPLGHRGANIPVKDSKTGRVYITAQNRGYTVKVDSLKQGAVSYLNVNDGSVEGITYDTLKAISVQFLPEAAPGPDDTAFIYDQFIALIKQ